MPCFSSRALIVPRSHFLASTSDMNWKFSPTAYCFPVLAALTTCTPSYGRTHSPSWK
jgi:hypothetical protein